MGTRPRPVPNALLSPLNLSPRRQVLEMEILVPVPPQRSENDLKFEQIVREKAADAMEDALNSLRLDGASEQQLGAIMGSTRLECLLRLIDMDLEGVVLDHIATGGASKTLREVIALALVPELAGLL